MSNASPGSYKRAQAYEFFGRCYMSWAELRDGWIVLAVGVVALLTVFSAPTFALPFVFPAVIGEYAWSREQVVLLATFKFTAGAVAAVVVGHLIDVIGIRPVLISASILAGIALPGFMFVSGLPSYYAIGVCLGVAAAGIVVGVQVLIARHIHYRQGVALGIVMVGASAGGMLVPPLMGGLLEVFDWRFALATLSLGIWLVSLPMLFFLSTGDNTRYSAVTSGTHSQKLDAGPPGQTMGEFVREARFWLIAVGLILVAMADQGITQHTVLFLQLDIGLGTALVVTAMSLFSLFGIIGKLFFGWVYDKISIRGIVYVYFLLALSALLALPLAGTISLFAFILVRGFAHGGLVIDVPVLSKHCYGPQNLGRTIGIYTAVLQLGFALGPWLMGRMYDRTGSYDLAFVIFAGMSAIAGLCLVKVKPEYWQERIKSSDKRSQDGVILGRQYFT